MKIVGRTGREDIATLYLAEIREGKYVEFVESIQPPIPKREKWVLIVSTLLGCPVGCAICDAGGGYEGKLTKAEIFAQLDYLVSRHFGDREVAVDKFKIQFARMGEPSLNPAVLEVLKELPRRYRAPGLIPSISTVAPLGADTFFENLLEIKRDYYPEGRFQLQFSLHSTDPQVRDGFIPVQKWDLAAIAGYGERFFSPKDRKIGLNFALAEDAPVDPDRLIEYFDPGKFVLKLTPLNPTMRVIKNKMRSLIRGQEQGENLGVVRSLRDKGYQVIVSIGELEENKIGSNCGQYLKRFLDGNCRPEEETYRYALIEDR